MAKVKLKGEEDRFFRTLKKIFFFATLMLLKSFFWTFLNPSKKDKQKEEFFLEIPKKYKSYKSLLIFYNSM